MSKKPVISAADAASMIKDGDTFVTSGFVATQMPEAINKAIEQRYLETGSPKGLTLYYAGAQGNRDGSGADHFAHEGLLKRVIGGHYNMSPKIGEMIINEQIEAYNFPQGTLAHLLRDIAAHKLGTLTHVGLGTFVDPRNEGGKLNRRTTEDLVELVTVLGEERLLYKSQQIDIAFIRGTYADENGNVTLQKECSVNEPTAIAQAAKNCGGKVVVQVSKVVANGSLDPKLVKIPGIYVDAIVVCDNGIDNMQCQGCEYDGSLTGEFRLPLDAVKPLEMSAKKIIGRRAAMELRPDSIVNLGIGIPEYISLVANEEGIGDYMTMTVESGPVGGIPQNGPRFGGAVNVEAVLDQPTQFDFYDGGGIDYAFLGLAQADLEGNINVSKFGTRVAGCGGFINITQNAKRVFFCGTFTAGGIKTHCENGKLVIDQEGRERKFIEKVEQITFAGSYANKVGQPVKYITERAVFELRKDGVYLTEIAPGIDLQTQVLDLMNFTPKMEEHGPGLMDERIFKEELMGIKN